MKSLNNKDLKRALYTFVTGKRKGELLVVINYNDLKIDCLILGLNPPSHANITRYNLSHLINNNTLEKIENLPKDVFSNLENTWKNIVDKEEFRVTV